jgi:hypothetical protein
MGEHLRAHGVALAEACQAAPFCPTGLVRAVGGFGHFLPPMVVYGPVADADEPIPLYR